MNTREDCACPKERQNGIHPEDQEIFRAATAGLEKLRPPVWGGATRRLIYDFHSVDGVDKALKLDFDAPGFVAAKLTHALPGALWVQGPIEWTLRYPDLIVASVWLWTIAELAVGLGLMLGLATRAAAFGSFWLNVVLMLAGAAYLIALPAFFAVLLPLRTPSPA